MASLKARRCSSPARAAASASRSRCARRATAPTSRSPPRPAEPHPKLPGTIYTAAEEIEKAGGKALPLVVRHPRRGAGGGGGGEDGRDVRRHRHPASTTPARSSSPARSSHRHEALRPDAPASTRAARSSSSQTCIPHLKKARQPAHAQPLAAARHGGEVVRAARRLHDGEVRHEHVRARHGRGVQQATASPSTRCGRAPPSPPPRSATCSAATR